MLRNPVDRTYSHYHLSKQSNENREFRKVIEEDMENISTWNIDQKNDDYFSNQVQNSKIARGFYHEQLVPWYDIFSKEQIMIIPSEKLASETQHTLKDVFEFLGLPEYNIKNTKKVNVSKYRCIAFISVSRFTIFRWSAICSRLPTLWYKKMFIIHKKSKRFEANVSYRKILMSHFK